MVGVGHLVRRHQHLEGRGRQGEHHPFRRADRIHTGDQRQDVRGLGQGEGHGPPQQVRRRLHIGIREEQPFRRLGFGLAGGQVQGVVLPQPAGGQGVVAEHAQAVRPGDFPCPQELGAAVRGAVIHHEDAQGGIVLGQPGIQGGGQFQGLVAHGDAQADGGRLRGQRGVRCQRGQARPVTAQDHQAREEQGGGGPRGEIGPEHVSG